MDLVFILEQRFDRSRDGSHWSGIEPAKLLWMGSLGVFDRVRVVARVRRVETKPDGTFLSDVPGVDFVPVPYYVGPWAYLRSRGSVQRAVRAAPGPCDAILVRAPSNLSAGLTAALARHGRPFGLQVVGDPADVFAPGAVTHPLRPFFRALYVKRLRREARSAAAVTYVTRATLQRRYPAAPAAFVTSCSDVHLPDDAFAPAPRAGSPATRPPRVVFVGSLDQLYKAPDVLLRALAICRDRGRRIDVTMIGGGRFEEPLRALGRSLGLSGILRFTGQISSSDAVRSEMDAADLFVLPSRTEGLPRAMIEAMARGLPCIGSHAGGITELLDEEDRVAPGDAGALASKLEEVFASPARLAAMSARNLSRARDFSLDRLVPHRLEFLMALRDRTEAWLRAGRGC